MEKIFRDEHIQYREGKDEQETVQSMESTGHSNLGGIDYQHHHSNELEEIEEDLQQ